MTSIKDEIQRLVLAEGFSDFRWQNIEAPTSFPIYKDWVAKKSYGDMQYLETHLEQKSDPAQLFPSLQSLLVLTHPYWKHPYPISSPLKIASYAQGEDYHFWIQNKHSRIIEALKKRLPDLQAKSMVDSQAFLERNYAAQTGLGWIGKNNCLIDRKQGSLFFISEILLNLTAESCAQELIPDFCGTCDRCITSCPTQAIDRDRSLIADRCISYLTIEAKGLPPAELRKSMGDHFFGCDICQMVCPWNSKIIKALPAAEDLSASRLAAIADLKFLLEASGKQILKKYYGTPLVRAGHWGLRRNALIVIGNMKYKELEEPVRSLMSQERLSELVKWCLGELENQS